MRESKQVYLGTTYRILDGICMAEEFMKLAIEDEESALILCNSAHYNQSVYYYIQFMEKYVKSYICKRIDVTNQYFAERLRNLGHSLDIATDFLIEIIAGNDGH